MARGPVGMVGIESARSSRSHCRKCKCVIAKGATRLMMEQEGPVWARHQTSIYFLCKKCGLQFLKDEFKNLEGLIWRMKNGFVRSRSLQSQG